MALKAIEGKKRILMFRKLSEAETKAADKLAFQTEHEWSKERDTDEVQTKSGPVISSGGVSRTLSISALSTHDKVNEYLEKSVDDGEMLEVWDIDLSSPEGENKYPALYARGYLNSWTTPASVDDMVSFDTEMNIEGVPVKGKVTLTEEQQEDISYAFRDVTTFVPGP